MQVAEPLAVGAREPASSASDYEMTAGASSSSWAAAEPASMELELQDADGQEASAMELEADPVEPDLGATSEEVEMGEAELDTAEPVDEEIVDYAEDDAPQASLDPGDEELAAASSPAPLEDANEVAGLAPTAPAPTVAEAPSATGALPSEEQVEPSPQPAERHADSSATAPELAAASQPELSDSKVQGEASTVGAAADAQHDEVDSAVETAALRPSSHEEPEDEQAHETTEAISSTHDAVAEHDVTVEEVVEPSIVAEESGSEDAEADGAEDDDGTIDDQPPCVRLTFAGQDFVLFAAEDCSEYLAASKSAEALDSAPTTVAVGAPPLAAPTEAFHEGLDSLFEALRVRDSLGDFLEERTELVLHLPELELTVREDDIYAREVTLADLHRLHVGGGLLGSLHLVVSEAPRFISRYNLLAAEISVEDGDDTSASVEESAEALPQEDEEEHDEGEEVEAQPHVEEASHGEQQHEDGEEAGDAQSAVEPASSTSHIAAADAADGTTEAASRADEHDSPANRGEEQIADAAAETLEEAHEQPTGGEGQTEEVVDDAEEEAADEAEEQLEEYVEEDDLEAQEEDAGEEDEEADGGVEAEAEGASLGDEATVPAEAADPNAAEEHVVDYEEHADEAASLEEPSALASADNGFHEEDASEHAHGKRPFAEPDDDEQDEASSKRAKVD